MRKRLPTNFCSICLVHPDRCICEHIPTLTLKTKITLVIHSKELIRTTNTGKLALHALTNSEMRIRGGDEKPLLLTDLLSADYRTFLLFPTEDAIELDDNLINESSLPIQLIVPDGNWRQARKVNSRHKELKNIPRVKISKNRSKTSPSMRVQGREEGMATLQAIAHALGVIEGDEIKDALMRLYTAKLDRTLEGRVSS